MYTLMVTLQVLHTRAEGAEESGEGPEEVPLTSVLAIYSRLNNHF
jgi:hypothetical protein